jgi:hypothetical protein
MLETIEDLAVPTLLAQRGCTTPLQSYYRLAKTVKPEAEGRDRFRDHGILSALILLHQFCYFDHCLKKLKGKSLPSSINRESLKALGDMIKGPVTLDYEETVHQAAAAIALHNVNKGIWDMDRAKQDPYFLSLQDYRITLEESPLAFLLAVTDVLQCWDRPKRRFVDTPEDFSVRSQDVRIVCKDDVILWSVREDEDAGKRLVSPKKEINVISTYLACHKEGGLRSLIQEQEWSDR